ncbi:MAG: enoyl-CoA hydratase/carnithine racemase [Gammaproteobacteria bacterium]|jgi:enoyl-CoA hydratase/carnithine racemase
MIELEREGDVFILTMAAGENRWNTTFVRAFASALDEVEASAGPAVLVTRSSDPKFFSNGLDLEWRAATGEHPGGERSAFGPEAMGLFARMITFPIPTVCAVNGHAFGAGFMVALCHDVRLMREDRGFLCANEVALGMCIPQPELALFRHKMSADAFVQTALHSRRWTGPDALAAGIVQKTASLDSLPAEALGMANELLGVAKNRDVTKWMKEHIYGENSAIHGAHGPAHMLRNPDDYAHGPRYSPAASR